MPITEYPAFEKYKALGFAGLFVGGCVERGDGSSFRARAHAHNWKLGAKYGWICVRSPKRLYNRDGNVSNTMKHELAHILTGQGHTDAFRKKLRELGGRATLNAKKRQRRTHSWEFIRADRILSGGTATHFRCVGHCNAHRTIRRGGF